MAGQDQTVDIRITPDAAFISILNAMQWLKLIPKLTILIPGKRGFLCQIISYIMAWQ